ncbi:MAG: hypothetical protein HGA45_29965, partial [Chloroflexales bacterium]|nr:hypothetical protein [Chloroflexales bacterium]
AREIAKLETPEARQPLINGVVDGSLSTSDVREVVREMVEQPAALGQVSAGPARSAGSTRERATPDPLNALRRGVARDLQAVRAILGRWELIVGQGEEERALVASSMGELTVEMERIALLLLADHPSS